MIILDTNLISAMMQKEEDPAVTHWLDQQELTNLHTTVITVHELHYGIGKMARGRRRTKLAGDVDAVLAALSDRILTLDNAAATISGQLQAECESAGRPIGLADCLIAGISICHGAALATRNIRHFKDLSIELINPWAA